MLYLHRYVIQDIFILLMTYDSFFIDMKKVMFPSEGNSTLRPLEGAMGMPPA